MMNLQKILFFTIFLGSTTFASLDPLRFLQVSDAQNYMGPDNVYRQNNTTYYAWMDAPSWRTHFALQRDGEVMEEPRIISGSIEAARSPSISGDGNGTLYVSFIGGGLPVPYFMHSEDGGKNWSEPFPLSTQGALWVRMAVSGNHIYLIAPLQDPKTGHTSTTLFESTDAGWTWSTVRNDIAADGWSHSIAIGQNGSAQIAYEDVDMMIWYVEVRNAMHALNRVRVSPINGQGQKMMIKTVGPIVHIAWVDYSAGGFWDGGDVFHVKSEDEGVTWSLPSVLTNSHRVYPGTQEIEVDPLNPKKIYIAWEDFRRLNFPRHYDVYLKESDTAGDQWNSEQDLTSGSFPEDHMGSVNLIHVMGRLRVFFSQNHQEEFWKLWSLQRN